MAWWLRPWNRSRDAAGYLGLWRAQARPLGVASRGMLFDQEQHKRTMKVVAIAFAVVFLVGVFALGGVLLFT